MINFNLISSNNYKSVQDQLNGLIIKWLPENSYTFSFEEYKEGCVNFSLFIDLEADVLMSHGVADKNYMWRKDEFGVPLNNQKKRKHILLPGDFSINRINKSKLINLDKSNLHAVGWPRLDYLLELNECISVEAPESEPRENNLLKNCGLNFSKAFGNRTEKINKNVLWAPTHDFHAKSGLVMSTYPEFLPYCDKLSELFNFDISSHPRNRNDKTPTADKLIKADVVISDYGTIVWEALALGKVVIFPDWIIKERMLQHKKNSAEWVIFNNSLGWHAESFDHMIEIIKNPKPMSKDTRKFLDNYLSPSTYGCSGKIVADLLLHFDKNGL